MDPQTKTNPVAAKQLPVMKLVLLSLVIVFAVLLFVVYSSQKAKNLEEGSKITTSQNPSLVTATVSPRPLEGAFSLTASQSSVAVNSPVTVTLEADSNGKAVVGYDLILQYDPAALEITSATSLLPDFTVYPIKSADHYSVTATKKITSEDPSIFNQAGVLNLIVTPKKSGSQSLRLVSNLGNEKTQMVDETTKVIYPAVSEITLEVK
ncbi:hypothetical protein A2866_01875 [Candidatus Roizmanbacteria bacterium RIFCSPHIGHO2_01_FULL_39_8]|uniref:Cohesin domain-containing protein n=3 Tax=Candidatus Roizmaniibacteriota TaxID=1752723 RepID=A0A1F7GPY2_9BACT|nr:MAG: hypothetical protein A2866_01875 [Candidatus Roizmanbacteria bacterium RIFCSPHIGHO2_01_FULL_39_8]OGK27768.1 MAG: hypothetical protein A3C28_03900 [Candidatus Roizmanbacteria bacterium RIFCSPHIGHO2_02_FULL_39_9]OGK38093.1 MAG: hypothetical protein A3F60_03550 [Candidatus Roizmanbacteria bacterium RIFCSPHIGHO2_12_FULL_39_8]